MFYVLDLRICFSISLYIFYVVLDSPGLRLPLRVPRLIWRRGSYTWNPTPSRKSESTEHDRGLWKNLVFYPHVRTQTPYHHSDKVEELASSWRFGFRLRAWSSKRYSSSRNRSVRGLADLQVSLSPNTTTVIRLQVPISVEGHYHSSSNKGVGSGLDMSARWR